MRTLLVAALALLLLAPAGAQAGAELTVAAGARNGEATFFTEDENALIVCVTTPCAVADVTTDDGEIGPTLILDVPISDRWMVEGLLSRDEGDLVFSSPFSPVADRGTFESTTAQVGLLRQWERERLRPFVTGAVGVTRFEASVGAYEVPFSPGIVPTPVDEDVLSASVAAGVKAQLGARLALRFEGRLYWHDLPDRLGGGLEQQALSVGLTYRF